VRNMMMGGGGGGSNPLQTMMMVQQPTTHQQSSSSSPQQPLMATQSQQQQSQEDTNNSIPELDADAKQTLIQTHVGDLIPGERVIMFLTNLLHVSDSSGFQNNNNNNTTTSVWCCAMTYYRLLLFAIAHPPTSIEAPQDWNAAAWPTQPPPSVLQLPLAALSSVEKSVFAVSNANNVNNNSNNNNLMMMMNASNSSNNLLLQQQQPTQQQQQQQMGVVVSSKLPHNYQIRFTTASYQDTARAHEALLNYAFPGRRNLGYLFAFESKRQAVLASVVTDPSSGQTTVTLEPGRRRFDAVLEFERQFHGSGSGTDNSNTTSTLLQQRPPNPWSIWTATNATYQLCPSYPSIFVGPASLDERVHPDAARVVRQCAAFRSEHRLPALSWTTAATLGGGSIWRCAQPKIGLQGNRSSADELMLKHIAEAAASANALAPQPRPVPPLAVLLQLTGAATAADVYNNWMPSAAIQLKILDLRPRSAAMANRTGGYGYENTSNYTGCSLQFCNITNIHGVRDSYQKLAALCLSASTSDLTFRQAVEDTKWLSHIRLIWSAAWETAFWVHVHRTPVLLHCSHGWDRTSQVAALAELLLDPLYRTMEGFACLCEKEFMSFGHPFHTRCGHGEGSSSGGNGSGNSNNTVVVAAASTLDEGQISPIFLQFLDCVYQVVHQYPECFEFNTKYVLCLSEHIYSCRFGNFLCDTERERELVAGIRQRTHSVWDYLEERPDLRNAQFDPSASAGGGVLLMPLPTLLRNITLWTDRHCAQGPKPTLRWLGNVVDVVEPNSDDSNKFRRDQPGGDILTEEEVQRLLLVGTTCHPTTTTTTSTSNKDKKNETPSVPMPTTVEGTEANKADDTEKPLLESQSSQVSSNDGTSSNKNAPLSDASDLL